MNHHRPHSSRRTRETPLAELLDQADARVRAALITLRAPFLLAHAEDIAQEVRMRIWRAMEGESVVAFPASYLHKVVVTACIDALRAFRARPDLSQVEPVEGMDNQDLASDSAGQVLPPQVAHDQQLLDRLQRRLAIEPAQTRRLVLLHAQGFTTTEIARLCRCSEPSVRNRLYRLLPKLREELMQPEVDDER